MRFRDFEQLARAMWLDIPDDYKEGVDGVVVKRDPLPHPTLPDIYTLGECATEAYPSDFGGPDTIRSVVLLHHGSFQRLSELDPDFDWEEELWETLTHELRHHLESLADEDALGGVDYAADENFKRFDGQPFDPWFYRSGEERAAGVWQVEREFFIEREEDDAERRSEWVEFPWRGVTRRVRRPTDPGDVCFLFIEEGLETDGAAVTVVLVRRRGFGEVVRGIFSKRELVVVEEVGVAEALPDRGGDAG